MRVHVDTVLEPGGTVELGGEEHHYLSHVRRVRPGQRVKIRDANGVVFEARVTQIGSSTLELSLEAIVTGMPVEWPVELICAVPRRNVMDALVRQLGELGIQRLWPVIAERSVAKPKDAKIDRWRRIAEESTRQCGRATPLEIRPPAELGQVVDQIEAGACFVAHSARELPLLCDEASKLEPPPLSLALAIGPEGGFTESEVNDMSQSGWRPVSLGLSILRAETAAIVGATMAVALLGGFGQFGAK